MTTLPVSPHTLPAPPPPEFDTRWDLVNFTCKNTDFYMYYTCIILACQLLYMYNTCICLKYTCKIHVP